MANKKLLDFRTLSDFLLCCVSIDRGRRKKLKKTNGVSRAVFIFSQGGKSHRSLFQREVCVSSLKSTKLALSGLLLNDQSPEDLSAPKLLSFRLKNCQAQQDPQPSSWPRGRRSERSERSERSPRHGLRSGTRTSKRRWFSVASGKKR